MTDRTEDQAKEEDKTPAQPQPVDDSSQEDAAKERERSGGYQ